MEKCLFLDTETTGLSGGAGTVAFLVGAAWVEGEELVTEQYILGDHSDEPEMLLRLGELLKRFDTAVTFNGKTFDMPLLESRYTICRLRDHWRALDQLDLLPPARRVWKLRLQSCRLSNLEARVLGVRRENDLPGSEAPERFFRYLQTGDFSLLEEVIAHNLQDVVTLAVLLVKLAQLFDEPLTAPTAATVTASAGRWKSGATRRRRRSTPSPATCRRAAIAFTSSTAAPGNGSGRAPCWKPWCAKTSWDISPT